MGKHTIMKTISVLLLIVFAFTSCTFQTSDPKIKAISAGDYFSLLVDTNSNVWSSGDNKYGCLGDGTTENRNTFIRIKELSNITSVSAGRFHSLALDADGNVWSWGLNSNGQLGDGTKNNSTEPIKVEALSEIISISAGGDNSLALKKDGTVWAWGDNMFGQLGSERDNEEIPEQVPELSNINRISCAGTYCLAIDTEGAVWVWGDGIDQNLGVLPAIYTPQKAFVDEEMKDVYGTIGAISDIKGSYSGVIAIEDDDKLLQWGDTQKVEQVNEIGDVAQIGIGGYHRLAIDKNGALWAWGDNQFGQLGNGVADNKDNSIPKIVDGINNVVAADGGSEFTLVLRQDGTVWACGNNEKGQLGIGSFDNQTRPIKVVFSKENY